MSAWLLLYWRKLSIKMSIRAKMQAICGFKKPLEFPKVIFRIVHVLHRFPGSRWSSSSLYQLLICSVNHVRRRLEISNTRVCTEAVSISGWSCILRSLSLTSFCVQWHGGLMFVTQLVDCCGLSDVTRTKYWPNKNMFEDNVYIYSINKRAFDVLPTCWQFSAKTYW